MNKIVIATLFLAASPAFAQQPVADKQPKTAVASGVLVGQEQFNTGGFASGIFINADTTTALRTSAGLAARYV